MIYIRKLTEISMSDFKNFERIRGDFYEGPLLETGGTSIKGKGAAPGVKFLYNRGYLSKGATILDYGAGKYARNADYLREKGYTVYAYDPFNGLNRVNGYKYGTVSDEIPEENFDVVFTSFVLNVVPFYEEKNIVVATEKKSKGSVYHITRNKDIYDTTERAIERRDPKIMEFFYTEYKGEEITPNILYDFCCYGVATSRGFQRIPTTEVLGYDVIKVTSGFKIYER